MKPTPIASDYGNFLIEVKGRIQSARLQAGWVMNRELVMLYWDIGRGIVEKQQKARWGEAVVERLAADFRGGLVVQCLADDGCSFILKFPPPSFLHRLCQKPVRITMTGAT
jgi:DUF1016 N-terminal domain